MSSDKYNKSVAIWLLSCCIMLLIMVWIGGVTRLTNSGLSITEWKPVMGSFPPIYQGDWNEEFSKYKNTPEYLKVNSDITISEFKRIYLIEYFHRLFGRLMGFFLIIPAIYFLFSGRIDSKFFLKIIMVFSLGVLQALVGWIMVKSGLIDVPYVNPVKLSIHLIIALLILCMVFYIFMVYSGHSKVRNLNNIKFADILMIVLIFLQIFAGGLVAGSKAGYVYNTFPLMDGDMIPSGIFEINSMSDFLSSRLCLQFFHRLLGVLLLFFVVFLSIRDFYKYKLVLYSLILQIFLGILVLVFRIPLFLASLHQVFAFVVAIVVIYSIFRINNCKK